MPKAMILAIIIFFGFFFGYAAVVGIIKTLQIVKLIDIRFAKIIFPSQLVYPFLIGTNNA
jgi:hypothetical protein